MVQPEALLPPQEEQTEFRNRVMGIVALYGQEYFAPLIVSEGYDPANEIERTRLRNAYDGLPKELTEEEVRHLGILIRLQMNPEMSDGTNTAEVRTLKWLGSISNARGDETTSQNVTHTLRHKHGIRGKTAAIGLWFERTLQH